MYMFRRTLTPSLKKEEESGIYMMDKPTDEKIEYHNTIQDDKIENLDKSPIEKTENLASEMPDESTEVQSDSRKTLKDQDIDMQRSDQEKNYTTEVIGIQIDPTDRKTEKNQDIEMRSTDKEKIQVVKTKITEEMGMKIETGKTQKLMHMKSNDKYDYTGKLILESMEHNIKKVTENICTADSTTDANTIIIDLCDDDQTEMCEQTDSENILASNINLESNNECDSSNKATLEKREDSNEKEGENVTTSVINKQTLDTITIDLCDDDQIEMYEKRADRGGGTLSQNERGNFSGAMPENIVTKPKESRGKTGPIQITQSILCDDSESETEMETSTIKNITKAELKTYKIKDEDEPKELCELTDEDVSEEACELTDEDEPKEACQLTGEDMSEAPCQSLLKCHSEGVDPDHSNIEKNVNLTGKDRNDGGCFETVSVNIEENCEASLIKDKSDKTEIKTKNEKYEIESFRFKDDIITLQEDYGMDPKHISKESSYNLEKSDMVSEDAKFTILDESDSEENRCDKSEQILGCGREDVTKTNARISETSQSVSRLEEQETTSKLKKEETQSRENIGQEQGLKPSVNDQEDIQLILIKKEIEDDLKHLGGIGIKEKITSATEKGGNSSVQSETIPKQGKHEDNIQVSSTSESANFRAGRLSEDSNQQTARADIKNKSEKEEKSKETNNGEEIESCTKNVQLKINLDIAKSKENDNNITVKQEGIPGCAVKGGDSKVCQTENTEDTNKNPASAYLNDTPPSHYDSNEEFFDAVEYTPEVTAAKETALTIKPSTALLSMPSLNEPIPGPSGISTKRNRNETSVTKSEEETEEDFQVATEFSSDEDTKFPEVEKNAPSEKSSPRDETLKTKESRKHDDMGDDDENKNQKKIKLD